MGWGRLRLPPRWGSGTSSGGESTPQPNEAHDFGLIPRALSSAHELGLPELELVLRFDSPDQVTAISFDKFRLGLSRTRKENARA